MTEIDTQLVSRAGFLKERMRKTGLGLKIISDKMLLLIMSTSLLLVRILSVRVAELLKARVSLQIVWVNEKLFGRSK